MVTLIQFPPALGLPCPSPFCTKAEVLLKLAEQPYEVEHQRDPRKAPKGKLPALRLKDKVVGDSEMIRLTLEAEFGKDLDAGLSPEERAAAHAFCRLLEERLYWVIVYSRWVDEAGWEIIRETYFSSLPVPLRWFVPGLLQSSVLRDLKGHGLGRHSRDEIYAFGVQDVAACAAWLGEKAFFMGDRPSSADATVFTFLWNLQAEPCETPPGRELNRHANLKAYISRCRQLWFPAGEHNG